MLAPVDTAVLRQNPNLIVAIIGRDVALTEHEKAGYFSGPCPFCGEGDDRFKIFQNTKLFNCRVCGKKGDVIEYIRLKQGLDFVTAAKLLGLLDTAATPQLVHTAAHHLDGREWDAWRARLEEMVIRAVHYLHDSDQAAPARDWLTARGVTRETWGLCAIGFNPAWKTIVDGVKLPPGILLPRFSPADGVVAAVNVYLSKEARETTGQRRMYVRGSRPKEAFFNGLWLKEASTAVIAEGELDAALLGRFLPNAAVCLASGGCETIPDLTGLDGKRVVLCLDNDEAGQSAVNRWLEKLPGATVATVPDGHKDITDWFKAGGMIGTWAKEILASG